MIEKKTTQKNAKHKFPKGNPGRKKGVPNKATQTLREMILGALDKAGGEKYLYTQAIENPTAFLTLIGKVLPTTLAGDPSQPLVLQLTAADVAIL